MNYIVLVILFGPNDHKKKYALVQLGFLNAKNLNRHFLVSANAGGLMTSAKELRKFFRIDLAPNLGELLHQFATELVCHIPKKVSTARSNIERQAIVHTLSQKDSADADKVYCYAVKRNPTVTDKVTEPAGS